MNTSNSPTAVQEKSRGLAIFFEENPGTLISIDEIERICGIPENDPGNKKADILARCKRLVIPNDDDRELVSIIRGWYAFCRKNEVEGLKTQAREKPSREMTRKQVRKILQESQSIPVDILGLHEKITKKVTILEVRQAVSNLVKEEEGFFFSEDKDTIVYHDLEVSAEIQKDFSIEQSVVLYKSVEIENLTPEIVSILQQLILPPAHTTRKGSIPIANSINTRFQADDIPFHFTWHQKTRRGRLIKAGETTATAVKSSNCEKTQRTFSLSEKFQNQEIVYKNEVLEIDINGSKKKMQGLSREEAKILTYYLEYNSKKLSITSIYNGEYNSEIHIQAMQLISNINTILRDYGLERHKIETF